MPADLTLFDALPCCVCLVDHNMTIMHVNDEFSKSIMNKERCLSLSFHDFFKGQTDRILFSSTVSLISINYQSNNSTQILGSVNTLKCVNIGDFPVYIRVHWVAKAFDEKSVVLTGSVMDIATTDGTMATMTTDIHGNESIITQSEFIDFFQKAPISLHWLSGTGHVIWANETELQSLGYAADEYIGHHISEFCPDEPVLLQEVFGRLGRGEAIHDVAFRFRTKSNKVKVLLIDSNVNWNPDGSFRHTRCFIRDITEDHIRSAIEKTEHVVTKRYSQAKDAFLQVVFHNLRTPLHVISGILEHELNNICTTTSTTTPDDDDRIEMKASRTLRTVQEYLNDIVNIVEDVAIASMFERNLLPVMKANAGVLSSTINTIISGIEVTEQVLGCTVNCIAEYNHYDKAVVAKEPFYAIPSLLPRVLFHLLKNAVTYSSSNSTVRCSVTTAAPDNSTAKPLPLTYPFDDGGDDSDGDGGSTKQIDYIQIKIENSTSSIVSLEFFLQYCRSFHNVYAHEEGGSHGGGGAPVTAKTPFQDNGLGLGLYLASHILECLGSNLSMTVVYDESASVYRVCSLFTVSLTAITATAVAMLSSPMEQQLLLSSSSSSSLVIPQCWGSIESSHAAAQIIEGSAPLDGASVVLTTDGAFAAEASQRGCNECSTVGGTTSSSPSSARLFRILVVDDSSICQKLLVKILRQHSFITDVANNGQEACDKLTQVPCCYDAVLMDIRMPVMDGITATKFIRSKLQLTIPIIAVSAEIDPSTRAAAMDAGTNGFLSKPSKLNDVLSLLKQKLQMM